MEDNSAFSPLTPKLMVQLAAPHTWPASILPPLIGTCLAIHTQGYASVSLVLVILCISVLMQSAVNTFNDYVDFKKGADTKENQVDPTDAVLVFNNVNPAHVKRFAIILMVVAFALGLYVIYRAGWIPLALACIGALTIYAYSGGKTPISYLPIGEFVSGFVMGTLIMFAAYQALTLDPNPLVLLLSLPQLIGIGLILMTNNTCDIEKDIDANRHTLPVLVGRPRARRIYHAGFYCMVASVCLFCLLWFRAGLLVCPFMILALYPFGKALMANPLVLSSRIAAMTQVLSVNVIVGAFYAACILAASPACVLVV